MYVFIVISFYNMKVFFVYNYENINLLKGIVFLLNRIIVCLKVNNNCMFCYLVCVEIKNLLFGCNFKSYNV